MPIESARLKAAELSARRIADPFFDPKAERVAIDDAIRAAKKPPAPTFEAFLLFHYLETPYSRELTDKHNDRKHKATEYYADDIFRRPLDKIDRKKMELVFHSMTTRVSPKTGKLLAHRTVRYYLKFIEQVLQCGISKGLCSEPNPAAWKNFRDRLSRPKRVKRETSITVQISASGL